MKIKIILIVSVIALLLSAAFANAQTFGGGSGTINQLDQWKSSAGSITQNVSGKPVKLTGLTTGLCLALDSNGVITTTACGDVTSSSTSTDNAFVRFDGTTGKIIQGGYTSNTPTISDAGLGQFSAGLQSAYLQGTAIGGLALYPTNGTSATTSIRFMGNNGVSYVERMTLLSNGNFGIGTTTPASKLHIDGGTATASNLKFTLGTTVGQTATDGFDVGVTSAGVAELRQRENLALEMYTGNTLRFQITGAGNGFVDGLGSMRGAGGTAAAPFWTFSGDPSTGIYKAAGANMGLATGGVSRMFLDSAGNVGIGTTTPSAKLSVAGTARIDSDLRLYGTVTASNYSELQSTTDTANGSLDALYIVPPVNQSRIFFGKSGKTAYSLNFSNVSSFESVPATISQTAGTANGYSVSQLVGAGDNLVLSSQVYSNGGYISSPTSPTAARRQMAFRFLGADSDTYKRSAGFIFTSATTTSAWTSPHTIWSANSEATPLMTLSATGSLGIGTTTPAYLLDVAYSNASAGALGAAIRTRNFNSAGSAEFRAENSLGYSARMFKLGSTYAGYKNLNASDIGFYNDSNAGNISILNDYASGKITMVAGARTSTGDLVIDTNGNVGVGTTTPRAKFTAVGDSFISGAFRDSTFATGTLGQILLSTGTSTLWVSTSTLGISGGSSGLATGTPNTMIYYNASGTPTEISHASSSSGQVLTLVGGIIIGDDATYPLVTGLGTATLTVDWDSGTYARLLDYALGGGIGGFSPMTTDPATMSAGSGTGYTTGNPMVLVETNTTCGGLGYDEPTCTATGARVGDPAGYYVSGGVWRSISGGGETGGPLVPTWVTP